MDASERAVLRIREELHLRKISQEAFAETLTLRSRERWTQSRLGKVLTRVTQTRLDEIALMADCLNLTLSEVVRDRGLEFYAELTPSEVRLLERLRQRPHVMDAIFTLLGVPNETPKTEQTVSKRRKVGRPLNSSLNLR